MRLGLGFFAALLTVLATVAAPPAVALDLDGAFTPGGLVTGRADPGSRLWLDDAPVKVGADGRFVFGFGRDAALEAKLRIAYPDGRQETRPLTLEPRSYEIQRIDGLPPRQVTLSPADLERRRVERTKVVDARDVLSDLTHWGGGFMWPVAGRISGVYGSQRILNGKPRSPHFGIDIAAPTGTPVKAPAAGVVRLAEPDFLLEGGIIIIDHGFGVSSTLFHLNTVDVAVGTAVGRGDVIATVGATGRATGPHLDWRVNWRAARLDPALLAGPMTDGE